MSGCVTDQSGVRRYAEATTVGFAATVTVVDDFPEMSTAV